MRNSPAFTAELHLVVDLMQKLSLQTDPEQAADLYSEGLDKLGLVPSDRYIALSRRNLSFPDFRITRNSSWTTHPNPWTERDKLPLLHGGLLADILYSNQPAIIDDLPARLSKDDPAYPYIHDMKLLVSTPHFDMGQAINAGIILKKDPASFPFERIPMMIWQANLWGRATLNLVTQQKLQAAHDEMDHELKIIADIQRSLLPSSLPNIPNAQLAVHYQTSQRSGGDYYDFFPLPDGRWGIFLADVSGHGSPAAVLMAITHAIAHTRPGHPAPPEQLLSFVNDHLARHYTTHNGNFVTAIYAILDPHNLSLSYASAGHPPPRLIRQNKILDIDGTSSLPLGVTAGEPFHPHTIKLQPNDHLILYTDGIIEAFNPASETFDVERLDAACLALPNATPDELLTHLLATLQNFTQTTPITDDRTLLALRLT